MKTPKGKQDTSKNKLNAPKLGKVSKHLGNVSNAKNSKIPMKNAEHGLNALIKEDPSEIKIKGNKSSSAFIGGANKSVKPNKNDKASNSPNKNLQNQNSPKGKSPKLSKKAKKLAKLAASPNGIQGERVTIVKNEPKKNKQTKIPKPKSQPSEINTSIEENNSSPVKKIKGSKTVKSSFDISSPSLKNAVGKELKFDSSEIKLGNETTLSPKSKKAKKKKLLKNKVPTENISLASTQDLKEESKENSAEKTGKRKKRRRRSKSQTVEEVPTSSLLNPVNVKNGLNALMKTLGSKKTEKKELFDEEKYIFLQLNLLKGSSTAKGVLHISLPNLILPGSPDVLLITPDLKGKRNDPDEAIDHYTELLNKNNIDFVSEIIPIRKLKKDYSQFEEKTKLANRFDAILVDGRVNKMARIGRKFARSKKCVSAVKLECNNLKNEFEKALRKVALFSAGTGNSFSVKCGRVGMSVDDICANIIEIGKSIATDKMIVGDKKNINSIYVKTALSNSFPLYVAALSPNEVSVPKGKVRDLVKPVKGEVSTVEGADVVVYPSGAVKVKKRKNENVEPEDVQEDSPKASKKAKTQSQNKTKKQKSDEDFHHLMEKLKLKRLESLRTDSLNTGDDSDSSDFGSSVELCYLSSDEEGGDKADVDVDVDSEDISPDEDDEENDSDVDDEENDSDEDDEENDSDEDDEENDSDDDDDDSDVDIKKYEQKYINRIKKLQQLEAGIKESEMELKSGNEKISALKKKTKKGASADAESMKTTLKANVNKKNKKQAGQVQVNTKPSKSNATTGAGTKKLQFQKKPRVIELTKGPKKAK